MDIAALLALDRPLTDEEFAFLEERLLATTRELHAKVQQILAQIPPGTERTLTRKLRRSADRMLRHVENAASLDTGGEPPSA
jgi:uncharacterized membrane protein